MEVDAKDVKITPITLSIVIIAIGKNQSGLKSNPTTNIIAIRIVIVFSFSFLKLGEQEGIEPPSHLATWPRHQTFTWITTT